MCLYKKKKKTKTKKKQQQQKTITDADYADDIAILANTPNQAETLLQSLERAAAGIGLHVNAHKTEYMCYNQTVDISTLVGTSLKLVDKITCLGSSVSSTEKDIDTRLTKAWTAIDRLSIIWKSDLTDKMKRSFLQAAFRPICPPAFFRCLSNSGTFTELRTTSFIESIGLACSDSINNNRVQVLSIPVLLFACSQDWTCNLPMIVSLEALGINAYNAN